MSLVRHQKMICFDDGPDRFQMRASGIALRDGHVLLQRGERDDYWVLPGGRIEQGEASRETLLREMEEELGVTAEVGSLSFVLESFFGLAERTFHEVGFYHAMILPGDFPFSREGVCHRVQDGGIELEFRWIDATEPSLAAHAFRPMPLRPHLFRAGAELLHLIDRQVS